jgi:hypothetical protein
LCSIQSVLARNHFVTYEFANHLQLTDLSSDGSPSVEVCEVTKSGGWHLRHEKAHHRRRINGDSTKDDEGLPGGCHRDISRQNRPTANNTEQDYLVQRESSQIGATAGTRIIVRFIIADVKDWGILIHRSLTSWDWQTCCPVPMGSSGQKMWTDLVVQILSFRKSRIRTLISRFSLHDGQFSNDNGHFSFHYGHRV